MSLSINNTVIEIEVISPTNEVIYIGELVNYSGAAGSVSSVNGETGDVTLNQDDIGDGTTYKQFSQTEKTKLSGIETGAEVNNISDINATDLTDGGNTTLHTHDSKQDALGFTPENIANKVTSFQVTPDNTHYPSEKLVKDSLDGKQASGSYEVTTNKKTDLSDNSDTYYPSQKAVKTVVDGKENFHGIETFGALSFNNTSHILTIASGTNTYWYKGTKYTTANAITCDIDSFETLTANTLYFFYFDDATGTLKCADTPWNFKENVFVCTVFWNGTEGALQPELHSHTRDLDWHIWAHDTIGTRYESGFDKTAPTTANDAVLTIEVGTLHDEDQDITTTQQSNCRVWYKVSANVYTYVDSNLPYAGSAGTPQYLDTDTYTLTDVGASNYVNVWVYASLDNARNIYIIPTHAATAYNTIALARAGTQPVTLSTNMNSEMKLIYKFIYKGDGQFQESVDYRSSSPVPGGGTSSNTASSISFVPTGSIASTNVQSAITELDTEKEPLLTGAASKATINDNDRFIIENSESSNATSYNLWSVIKSTLKTYFDGLYFLKTIFTAADEIQVGTGSGTTNQITLGASQFLGKKSTGNVTNLSKTDALTILNVADGANNYTLPTASDSVLGGIKIGSGLSIDGNGVVTASGGGATLWTSWTGASRTSDGVISSTTHLTVGTAIRFKATGGTYRYGKILSLSTDAHSILGHPCTTSDDDVFEYDSSGLKSDSLTIPLPDNFNDADDDALLLNDLNMKLGLRPALCGEFYLVGFECNCKSADTSADPDLNIVVFGSTNKLFSADIECDLTNHTTANTAVVTYYGMTTDTAIDISVDKVGAGDAYDATITLHFVRA